MSPRSAPVQVGHLYLPGIDTRSVLGLESEDVKLKMATKCWKRR